MVLFSKWGGMRQSLLQLQWWIGSHGRNISWQKHSYKYTKIVKSIPYLIKIKVKWKWHFGLHVECLFFVRALLLRAFNLIVILFASWAYIDFILYVGVCHCGELYDVIYAQTSKEKFISLEKFLVHDLSLWNGLCNIYCLCRLRISWWQENR